jgi:hypothetical protein
VALDSRSPTTENIDKRPSSEWFHEPTALQLKCRDCPTAGGFYRRKRRHGVLVNSALRKRRGGYLELCSLGVLLLPANKREA